MRIGKVKICIVNAASTISNYCPFLDGKFSKTDECTNLYLRFVKC